MGLKNIYFHHFVKIRLTLEKPARRMYNEKIVYSGIKKEMEIQ